jgi:hypothetical protein
MRTKIWFFFVYLRLGTYILSMVKERNSVRGHIATKQHSFCRNKIIIDHLRTNVTDTVCATLTLKLCFYVIFLKQWLLQTYHKINRAISKKYYQKFLEKPYIPQETTVRKTHVDECYYSTLGEIPENA